MKIKNLLICLSIIFLGVFASANAASETVSLNSRDSIFISKVTPRTGSYIIPPTTFPYFLQVEYHLSTQRKGKVEIAVYQYPYNIKTGKKSLIKPVIQTIEKGSNSFLFTSTNLTIHGGDKSRKILLVASLKDTKGNELAYSTSMNTILGNRKVVAGESIPKSDYIQVLDSSPKAKGSILSGKTTNFKFKFSYGVKTTEYAFLNFEFCDINELNTGLTWESVCVPLTKGSGVMQVELPIFFPAGYKGKSMGIGVPFRIDPLGGTVSYFSIKPITFK